MSQDPDLALVHSQREFASIYNHTINSDPIRVLVFEPRDPSLSPSLSIGGMLCMKYCVLHVPRLVYRGEVSYKRSEVSSS